MKPAIGVAEVYHAARIDLRRYLGETDENVAMQKLSAARLNLDRHVAKTAFWRHIPLTCRSWRHMLIMCRHY
jgi:hypothetical protein